MTTIEKIKSDYEIAIAKIKIGEALTAFDRESLKIGQGLYAKKAGNAGKRKIIVTGK